MENPYQPPSAAVVSSTLVGPESNGDFWREGRELVMRHDAHLPSRCVKCNAPAARLKPRNFYWHHPALYLLIVVGVLLYALVAVIVRKRAKVAPGLCEAHAKRRLFFMLGAWLGALGGVALIFGGASFGNGALGIGMLLLFGCLIAGMLGTRIMVPAGINERHVRFRGCGKAFLASLPSHPGRREPV